MGPEWAPGAGYGGTTGPGYRVELDLGIGVQLDLATNRRATGPRSWAASGPVLAFVGMQLGLGIRQQLNLVQLDLGIG